MAQKDRQKYWADMADPSKKAYYIKKAHEMREGKSRVLGDSRQQKKTRKSGTCARDGGLSRTRALLGTQRHAELLFFLQRRSQRFYMELAARRHKFKHSREEDKSRVGSLNQEKQA